MWLPSGFNLSDNNIREVCDTILESGYEGRIYGWQVAGSSLPK
jgi:hypothetical protein